TAIRHRDGSRVPVELIMRTMERDGEKLRMAVVRDIRDRLASEARIQHLAHHDGLTGLLNRGAFMERMGLMLR
ncbi:PAS domain S-box protein, partial [Acinetobacter baumannii]